MELGEAVQQSLQWQEKIQAVLEQKSLDEQQHEKVSDEESSDDYLFKRLSMLQEDGDEVDEDDDDDINDFSRLSIYGMSTSSNQYSDKAQVSLDEERTRSWLRQQEARMQARERTAVVPEDAEETDSPTSTSTLLSSSTTDMVPQLDRLTDHDIVHLLGVSGGRPQLQALLVQGARARDTLVRSNIKLVVGIAKRWARMQDGGNSLYSIYSGGWDRPSLNEAVQEGILGLIKATERYQPSRELRFSTYATYWITNAIRQCFTRATTGVLRVPSNYYETRTRFRTLVKRYHESDGVVPPIPQLAAEMGMTVPRLQHILSLTRPLLSTDGPLRAGGTTRAGKAGNDHAGTDLIISDTLTDSENLQPEQLLELSFLRQSLENAMATELAPHERDVIRLRLGLDDGVTRTCRQVATEYYGGSLTTSEVRSAEKRAFKKLRSPHSLATYKLLSYLDFAGVDRETVSLR